MSVENPGIFLLFFFIRPCSVVWFCLYNNGAKWKTLSNYIYVYYSDGDDLRCTREKYIGLYLSYISNVTKIHEPEEGLITHSGESLRFSGKKDTMCTCTCTYDKWYTIPMDL